MSVDSKHADPTAAEFRGSSPAMTLRRALHATRPKFFPASILPVLAGSAWGVYAGVHFDWLIFLLALFATVCVHAASNVLNDVADNVNDSHNEDRIYPYTGGSRFIQCGIMSTRQMLRLGLILLACALVAGLLLLYSKGPAVLYFGLAGVAIGILYSLGPLRLHALGAGEIGIAAAFGVLPVCGAAWLQGAVLNTELLLYSLPVSAWVAAILLINEVPDIAADRSAGKRTLPVRMGLPATAAAYLMLQFAAAAVLCWLVLQGPLPVVTLALLLLLPVAVQTGRSIRHGLNDRPALQRGIERTLLIHTLGTVGLSLGMLAAAWAGSGAQQLLLTGHTMGTRFTVKLVDDVGGQGLADLQADIENELLSVNNMLSTFLDDSEISRFNQSDSLDWHNVSESFCNAVEEAHAISVLTAGSFDITSAALVNLWGFGPDAVKLTPPPAAEIERAKSRVGYRHLLTDCSRPALKRTIGGLALDMSAYGKGYAVDRISQLLDTWLIKNYMVEIGGEIRTAGYNASGKTWAVGIEIPRTGSRSAHTIIRLSNLAVATSGDYRNFFEHEGTRYSHEIDTGSGKPVSHGLAAVTVVDESGARADALATGLFVLGADAGLKLATEQDIAALFLSRGETGIRAAATPQFDALR